jgi:serine/threonine-protein kinase
MPFSEDKSRADRVLRGLTKLEGEQGPVLLPELSRYEILDRLGEGATAVVYRARDRELNRPVAVKILRASAGWNAVMRERFRREAQTAARISHPNVVAIHDVGEEEGQLYLVMELIEGRPLGALLAERSGDLEEKVRLLETAAHGVDAAHAEGIVHRDLKPANILIPSSGEPKVADFGLAHLIGDAAGLTRTGAMLGTPLYMAPEQVAGKSKEVTPRTDVYALGTILYEILTGHVPFSGSSMAEVAHALTTREPARPTGPADLVTVCLKALEKDPSRRYASAGAFSEELARFLRGEPVEARPPGIGRRFVLQIGRHRVAVLASVGLLSLATLFTGWEIRGRDPSIASSRAPLLFSENFETFDKGRWDEVWGSLTVVDGGWKGGKCLEASAEASLYKMIAPGLETFHARFYIKFDRDAAPISPVFQIVGYSPPTAWPQGRTGEIPRGDERFSTSVALWEEAERFSPPGAWYMSPLWCETVKADIGLLPERPLLAPRESWVCVEFMVRCNSSPETADGEQALWIDGREAGRWSGFRWRTDVRLKGSGLWILFREGAVAEAGRSGRVWLDDLAVSSSYIGPVPP